METRRRVFWLSFLGAAVLLAMVPEYFFPSEDEAALSVLVKVRAPLAPPATSAAAEVTAAAVASGRAPGAVPRADLFAAHSWYVAPAPVAVSVAVAPPPLLPPPSAPPLPFKFIGQLDDSERLQVFLLRGEEVLVVQEGDVIDELYRVERIGDGRMTLVYLPLHISQSMTVGGLL